LVEICEITSWKRPKSINNKKINNYCIPLIGATKIMWYVEDYLFDNKTLIIGRVWTHGKVQRFNEKIFPSDNTLVIKSENFIFVYQILRYIDYEKINKWAVQPLITQTDINNYQIIIPNAELLSKFKNITNSVFDKIDENSFQISSLSQTRDELLPKLMSGKVRVKDL
jgi:type I restriction enzyme S subunit